MTDLHRYQRQITLAGFGLDGQRRLTDAHVAVLGAGGLGSPALLYLAAAGVGEVTVIDDDVVSTSNLHRQVIHTDAAVGSPKTASARREMLARNPDITVHTVSSRLTAENAVTLLRGADVVLDGTDNFAARYACSHACAVLGIPHVWASILGFDGQLTVFGMPAGPVYEDVFPTPPPAGTVPSCSAAGVLGPVVGAIGTAMALEAVKVVTGVGSPLSGEVGYFDGLTGRWEYIPVVADPSVAARVRRAPTPVPGELAVEPSDEGVPLEPVVQPVQPVPSLEDAVLLDVREPDEYATVHIPGAVNVPLSRLRGTAAGVAEAAEHAAEATRSGRPLVVYCAAGTRSAQAIGILADAGITGVDYPGGINAWLERQ
ncbi:ThiF family adenylyltransferase [Corynebacterium kalidii]|uniref:ThiF family adenylyltransferase n=1 Tax=Corynebacterium kalidii TaxID=2931982 RepID=A0A9X1WF56_9CORY|nr:ThiF family adenylyltransferase [Corynebacterium kalidii]